MTDHLTNTEDDWRPELGGATLDHHQGDAIECGEERPGPNYLPDPDLDMDRSETAIEWEAAIQSLMWLRYNHSTAAVLRMAYGEGIFGRSESYANEKAAAWEACPLDFYGKLDAEHRRDFMAILRTTYRADALRWIAREEQGR